MSTKTKTKGHRTVITGDIVSSDWVEENKAEIPKSLQAVYRKQLADAAKSKKKVKPKK